MSQFTITQQYEIPQSFLRVCMIITIIQLLLLCFSLNYTGFVTGQSLIASCADD